MHHEHKVPLLLGASHQGRPQQEEQHLDALQLGQGKKGVDGETFPQVPATTFGREGFSGQDLIPMRLGKKWMRRSRP